MRDLIRLLCVLIAVPVQAQSIQSLDGVALPHPLSNNAVTSVTVGQRQYVVSFNGLGEGKTHSDTLDLTYVYDVDQRVWEEAAAVPGDVGRLASAATSLGELAYVFGGYTVAADGSEASTPWVHAFDPVAGTFAARAPMPVPVDDMIALSYRNRYVYLVSGWHDVGNVNLVQRYDAETDSWSQATPVPGAGIFGHAGGIADDQIVFCDGVAIRANSDRRRDFVASSRCYRGIIDGEDSRRIDWRVIDPHPGVPRYRMAAAGVPEKSLILFVGGTDNPYNFDGIGYDGRPSLPVPGALVFDLTSMSWSSVALNSVPTMDHRSLVPLGNAWATVGGMEGEQRVTSRVIVYEP